MALAVLLPSAVGIQALSSSKAHSRYSALLAHLVDATARLEAEMGWTAAQETSAAAPADLAGTFRDALGVFAAIRTIGHERQPEAALRWASLETQYRIDAANERARLGVAAGGMPPHLYASWHAEEESGASFEDITGSFLTLAHQFIQAKSVGPAQRLMLMEAFRTFGRAQLRPSLQRTLRAVTLSTLNNADANLILLMICAGVSLLVAVLNSIFILRPMQRTMLQNQELLVRERDRARASERAKRDFLAMMSHELRTPMNSILGFTHLLRGTELQVQQKHYADAIHASGETLLKLLSDILDMANFEAGSLQLQEAEFSLPDVVYDVIALLGPQAAAKRLDLSAYIDPALPERLKGDSGRVRQILVNLVSNAIKFTVSGGAGIEVMHEGGNDQTGLSVLMSVTDTGLGIAKDQRERIFERFTQVDSSASRPFEGSGLGLAICRELAQLMGGEIGMDSTPGKGSTFWVRIKLASVRSPAGTAQRYDFSLGGKRFLVVDDNALNLRISRLQLEAYGAEVVGVSDARAALTALAQGVTEGRPYDLAIIDQMMPEIDGLTLRKMIRDQPQHAGLKLIISSSGGIAHDRQARILGFDAACPKPIAQEELVRQINALVNPTGDGLAGGAVAVLRSKPARPGVMGKKPKLLVAEDNPVNQKLIVTALKQAGFAVDLVGDGVEAVHAVQRLSYDLVLMDIRMPVMSGVEATQRIRSLPGPVSKPPIIAMTANALVGDREEYLAAGMNDYVAKPIDLNILLAKIRAHLPRNVGEGTAESADGVPWKTEMKRL